MPRARNPRTVPEAAQLVEADSGTARRIAVTAPDGFIGRNLIPRLAATQGVDRIVAIGRVEPRTLPEGVRFVSLDVTQPHAFERLFDVLVEEEIDTVYHLDFLALPSRDREWAHEVEVLGTIYTMNAACEAGVRRFIMNSTTAVYGAHASNPNFLSERHFLRGNPGSRFFSDKVEAEKHVIAFAEKHPAMHFTTLRLATILGPHVDNFMTRYLKRGVVPTVMGYDPLMQFIHELDAIEAFVHAASSPAPGTYNIASRGVLPLSAVLRLLRRNNLPLPKPVFEASTRMLWNAQVGTIPPTFTGYLMFLWVADTERAEHEFGYAPRFGIKRTVLEYGALVPATDSLT